MAALSAVATPTTVKLTAEQILERMPNSSADELHAIYSELFTAYQCLQRIAGGQLLRLLGEEVTAPLDKTAAMFRAVMSPLARAAYARSQQQSAQNTVQQALCQAFPTLALIQTSTDKAKPASETLLKIAHWILIAETELHFSWLLTPTGNLDFFEQEQPRLLRFLTQYVLETIEQNSDYPFIQVMEVAIKQLREILSRPLNKAETVVFKRIQEELTVELSDNVVRLNTTRKQIKQGENQ